MYKRQRFAGLKWSQTQDLSFSLWHKVTFGKPVFDYEDSGESVRPMRYGFCYFVFILSFSFSIFRNCLRKLRSPVCLSCSFGFQCVSRGRFVLHSTVLYLSVFTDVFLRIKQHRARKIRRTGVPTPYHDVRKTDPADCRGQPSKAL